MTLRALKAIIERELEKGNGDAIVRVQVNAEGISDIVINDYEDCKYDNGEKVFSLISNPTDKNIEEALIVLKDLFKEVEQVIKKVEKDVKQIASKPEPKPITVARKTRYGGWD